MANQIQDVNDSNIIEIMNSAFNQENFYGAEYILDELASKVPVKTSTPPPIDWYGFWDFRG